MLVEAMQRKTTPPHLFFFIRTTLLYYTTDLELEYSHEVIGGCLENVAVVERGKVGVAERDGGLGGEVSSLRRLTGERSHSLS